ncbi:hypothetical protein A3K48_02975 [candidate division WOR-1 bacterium RIFOXYA12_FULL_52_29]|uniref:Potassium transporter TrkA n=1 Tax=candidate division WOR-1 bacterium RIFOXYC12_FULL_54_18 TaxID=1802584 RepID=A0A1F4T5X1_UNCSA|nr:MAG: hypothetical protein A3K44_02975 [candidate division WOR-1 bacterium RIFOXYA2_FULL_51_19]OGC17530.1 MAG: hypothetical protein A3K48_02975 [candidate division WOR-1 bacterium RIFOXYA12_FULL_52_29]OGC26387.1 MAG: hypothetical protein A3K32_02970 [candidate division WOR-1 bacterium RIFOXYB2_FULL_45_9]OGC27947.1 MAG: hypothetical protein A3K49_02975 [candidate division WOR-1 bacterium RIFOXYC12_FULL_54_18]OGC29766.1 MAG: hypothetical protein A2346_03360 [candidate division WOR-1 bacterium R
MKKNKIYELRLWRQFFLPLLILIVVALFGVAGFMRIDGFSLLEAFYMVVVTLTTVGYRPVKGMSGPGMIFDMVFVSIGVILIVVVIGRAMEFIVSGDFVRIRRNRRMTKKVESMRNHFIICGFGRVGHQIASEFEAARINYVIIDNKQETSAELEMKDIPYFVGDMTSDQLLLDAGIKSAKGLVAAADSDTDNVFVTLSARVLNPKLFIIARAGKVETEEKLRKAGADRVISPYFMAGKQMAALATKPTAYDFVDTIMHHNHLQVAIAEFRPDPGSKMINKTLKESGIRQASGAYVVTIKKGSGKLEMQPTAGSKIELEDTLVAIGTPEQLKKLEKMIG